MYSIGTTNGTKRVGNLEIVEDKVSGPGTAYSIRAIHSIRTKVFVVKTEKGGVSFPGFVEVMTNAGYVPANKLIPGLRISQHNTEKRIVQVYEAHSSIKVKKVSVPGPYYISGIEVRNT